MCTMSVQKLSQKFHDIWACITHTVFIFYMAAVVIISDPNCGKIFILLCEFCEYGVFCVTLRIHLLLTDLAITLSSKQNT